MTGHSTIRAALGMALLVSSLALVLSGCGKKGSPEAPGPANLITYPRNYPAD